MSNLISIIIGVLGFLPFLFVFWKRLKEDYSSSQIFESGFYIIFAIAFFVLIFAFGLSRFLPPSSIFSPAGLWFWGGVVGFAVGRTVFKQPLVDLHEKKISREEAIQKIASNFKSFADLFISSKN